MRDRHPNGAVKVLLRRLSGLRALPFLVIYLDLCTALLLNPPLTTEGSETAWKTTIAI